MTHVYVVTGESGEYSDWRLWLIAGFDTVEKAEEMRSWIESVIREASSRYREADLDFDKESALMAWLKTKAAERGLTTNAVGIPDGDEFALYRVTEIKMKIELLPWNTPLAGGIPPGSEKPA